MAATARACSLSGVSTAVATCALFAASFALAACGECLEPRGAPVADDASADAGIRAPDAGRVVVDAGPAPDDALPPNQSLAGGYFSCAFGASHELRCWGREEEGTLGPGGVAHTAPAPVAGLPRVTRAATGLLHACALAEDASVWCWGWGSNGQLGRAPGASAPARVAGLSEVVDVAVGGYAPYTNPSCHRSCALHGSGAVSCFGGCFWETATPGGSGSTTVATPTPVAGLSGVAHLAVGGLHVCAAKRDGHVVCWGYAYHGVRGDGSIVDDRHGPPGETLITVPGVDDVVDLSAGFEHTCAVRRDGAVLCWGSDAYGALGNGPSAIGGGAPSRVVELPPATRVAAGGRHTCALTRTGAVYCWGEGASGELGNGGQDASETPVLASVDGVATSVSAGAHHTCVRTGDGKTWCWGRNVDGQVDEAPVSYVPTPRAITGLE